MGATAVPWHEFEDAESLATQLAADIANHLRQAIATRGVASLIVSGGRSPIRFFALLSIIDMEWERVSVSLADERWVDANEADSNEKLVRDHLLINAASKATFIALKTNAVDPESALQDRLDALLKAAPFDVVVLGMGNDGHTASLFPDAVGLAAALDVSAAPALVAITPPAASHRRISMNLACLLDARHIAVSIQGAKKRAVYDLARAGASPRRFPIAAILQQSRVPVATYFCPDRGVAGTEHDFDQTLT